MLTYKRFFNPKFINKEPKTGSVFQNIEKENHIWFNSVRTGLLGIFDLLDFKPGDLVLLPAFAPHGIVLPSRKKKLIIEYYNLNDQLLPELGCIEKLLQKERIKAIFVIHYFGFPKDFSEVIKLAHKYNLLVFEDCAHTLFSDYNDCSVGKSGDISFFSLNKFLPVPDGSLFISNNPSINLNHISPKKTIISKISTFSNYIHLKLKTKQVYSKNNIVSFMYSVLSSFFYLFYYRLLCMQNYPSTISPTTIEILRTLDIRAMLNARITNALFLFSKFDFFVWQTLFKGNPITGIPILEKSFKSLRDKLHKNGIATLSYNKKWWFVKSSVKHNFVKEKYFHDNHFLIPVSENLTQNDLEHLVSILGNSKK